MLLDFLQLPAACHIQQKIPKKAIAEYARNSASAVRLLQDLADSILLVGHITPNNSNIAAFQQAENEYLEILVLQIALKDRSHSAGQLKSLHQLLHQAFPYPLLLEVISTDRVQWSLATKTVNQANPEHAQLVIQELLVTDWLTTTADALQQEFYQSLAFQQQNQSNLMFLYQGWISSFVRYLTACSLNQTTQADAPANYALEPEAVQQQMERLRQIQNLKQQISVLKNQRDACKQFNEKVALNLELQKLNKRLAHLADQPLA
ncbi:DUF4391 domain-containing protein [Orrella sp. 11846]|uniref:DUF4391 domain-containing protein n=1 Tax=Orrella sp. 11846 TaxID=3409913 RepID=UPI003B599718